MIKGWTTGELNALVKNLGEKLARMIQRGEIKNCSEIFENSQILKIWKTIKIGMGFKTADEFYQAITKVGGKISNYAKDIMGKSDFVSSISSVSTELDLCVMTTKEIIGKAGTLKEIYAGIKKLGGELVPAEVGPQLRLQYLDQPKGEWLLIAMQPIKDSDGGLGVFDVKRDGDGSWLYTYCDCPGFVWGSDCRWVFLLPRRK